MATRKGPPPVILILGRNGQVGDALCGTLAAYGEVVALGRNEVDLVNTSGLREVIRSLAPSVIVNAAAYTAVDDAESHEPLAMQINAIAPEVMAEEAKKINALLIHYSTDYVFDGKDPKPYTEAAATAPLNAYGRTKLAGEQVIQKINPNYLIFRTCWVYSARGKNFLLTMLKLMAEREELSVVDDQFGVPTSSRLIAETTAAAVSDFLQKPRGESYQSGLYHLSARGQVSWHGYAKEIVENLGCIDTAVPAAVKSVTPISSAAYPSVVSRPQYSTLDVSEIERRFSISMPQWQIDLKACIGGLQNVVL